MAWGQNNPSNFISTDDSCHIPGYHEQVVIVAWTIINTQLCRNCRISFIQLLLSSKCSATMIICVFSVDNLARQWQLNTYSGLRLSSNKRTTYKNYLICWYFLKGLNILPLLPTLQNDGLGKPQVLRIDKFGGTAAFNRENFGLKIAHFFLMYEFR